MRRDAKQRPSLADGFPGALQVCVLEVAKAAVNDALTVGGGCMTEVALLHQGNPQASLRGVEGDPSTVDSGADDGDIELAALETLRLTPENGRIHESLLTRTADHPGNHLLGLAHALQTLGDSRAKALYAGHVSRLGVLLLAALSATFVACWRSPICTSRLGVTPGAEHWMRLEGRSVLPVGDSVTQGWMELGLDFDQDAYLEALAKNGVNTLLLWTYIAVVDQAADSRIGYDAPELWPWVREGGRFDLTRFNDLYFERLRALVEGAAQRDILTILTVHDGWPKRRFEGHPFNVRNGGPLEHRRQYVELASPGRFLPERVDPDWGRRKRHQFLLERFCARLIAATGDLPNVAYEIFNEGNWYDQDDLHAFQTHFLDFFKARAKRPLLVNDDHVRGPSFHDDRRVDVVSLHKPLWDRDTSALDAFKHFAAHFARRPAKPYFFTEPVPSFLGDSQDLVPLMRLLWGTALAGSGFVSQNDTSFGFAPRTKMAGQVESRERLHAISGHAARFLNTEVGFSEMVPDGSVSSTCVGLARRGHEYALYVQEGEDLTVDLRDAPADFVGRLFDPWSGRLGDPFRVAGGRRLRIETPSAGDWVVHLVAARD